MESPVNLSINSKSQLDEINGFVNDILLLAKFAVESGRLPDQVQLSDIYQAHITKIEEGMPLSAAEIELLQYYYQLLKIELDPVTPASLRATQCKYDGDAMDTEAGKCVKKMWAWAWSALGVIFAINLFEHSFQLFAPALSEITGAMTIMAMGYQITT